VTLGYQTKLVKLTGEKNFVEDQGDHSKRAEELLQCIMDVR